MNHLHLAHKPLSIDAFPRCGLLVITEGEAFRAAVAELLAAPTKLSHPLRSQRHCRVDSSGYPELHQHILMFALDEAPDGGLWMIHADMKFSGLRRVEQGELPRVQSPLAYASGSCIVEYSESHDAPFFPERKIHQILPVFQGC